MRLSKIYLLSIGFVCLTGCGGGGDDPISEVVSEIILEEKIIDVNESLRNVSFSSGKTLHLTVGMGSGAFHFKNDDINVLYTTTNRGANIPCVESESTIGIKDFCKNGNQPDTTGVIFPVPTYTPTIHKLRVNTGTLGTKSGYEVVETIQLKDRDSRLISGLPNPFTLIPTERPYDSTGKQLSYDVQGVNPGAVVKLSNNTYWLSDEYAPGLIHTDANGRILERLVPRGLEQELSAANYTVQGILPTILALRQPNQGIKGLAVSPDEDYLYFIMQSPLANPNGDAFKQSRYVRLVKLSLRNSYVDNVVGEYVYTLDTPDTFRADNSKQQSEVKVTELVALDKDKLLAIERIKRHTKVYQIARLDNATNINGTEWDNFQKIGQSLELLPDLISQGITPVTKKSVFDSAVDMPDLEENIGGLAILNRSYVAFTNENQFGITGAQTRIIIRKIYDQLNR